MSDLRRVWASVRPEGEHVDEATWERFALGELDGAARARLVEHVSSCAGCARAWRAVNALATEARAVDPALPAPSAAPVERPRRNLWRAASVGLAAAAALVFFVSLRRDPAPETLRGAPQAAINLRSDGPRVTWTPVAGAEEYRVRVFSEDGRPLWSVTTSANEASWPDAVAGSYSWSVEAQRGGDVIARSRLEPFRLSR